jgi:hypothetical protein
MYDHASLQYPPPLKKGACHKIVQFERDEGTADITDVDSEHVVVEAETGSLSCCGVTNLTTSEDSGS